MRFMDAITEEVRGAINPIIAPTSIIIILIFWSLKLEELCALISIALLFAIIIKTITPIIKKETGLHIQLINSLPAVLWLFAISDWFLASSNLKTYSPSINIIKAEKDNFYYTEYILIILFSSITLTLLIAIYKFLFKHSIIKEFEKFCENEKVIKKTDKNQTKLSLINTAISTFLLIFLIPFISVEPLFTDYFRNNLGGFYVPLFLSAALP